MLCPIDGGGGMWTEAVLIMTRMSRDEIYGLHFCCEYHSMHIDHFSPMTIILKFNLSPLFNYS